MCALGAAIFPAVPLPGKACTYEVIQQPRANSGTPLGAALCFSRSTARAEVKGHGGRRTTLALTAPHRGDCWGSPELIPMAMEQRGVARIVPGGGATPSSQLGTQRPVLPSGTRLAEPPPAVPARLGAGGEARDLDMLPLFPLKLLLSLDSSSA